MQTCEFASTVEYSIGGVRFSEFSLEFKISIPLSELDILFNVAEGKTLVSVMFREAQLHSHK